MGYFEQLLKTGSINLIIGGALIALAVIALIWMYLWFKKTKEYKNILKSINDKVDACSKEEVGKIWKEKDISDKKEKTEDETVSVEATDEKVQSKWSFNRASAAIETLENDEKTKDIKIEENSKLKKELLKVEMSSNLNESTDEMEKKEITKNFEENPAPIIEKIHFDKTQMSEKNADTADEKMDSLKDSKETSKTVSDDEECEVDVFAEIRKMLVETEKESGNKILNNEFDESDNVARSGKEYTREELEKLIKF